MRDLRTYLGSALAALTAAAASACTGATARVPPPAPVAVTTARVIKQAPDGFRPLASGWQKTRSSSFAPWVAQNSDELAAEWSALELTSKVPAVDFATSLVLGLCKRDPCNTSRIKELVLTSQAQLRVLELEHSGTGHCAQDDRVTTWIIAVSRAALPQEFDVTSPTRETLHVIQHASEKQPQQTPEIADVTPLPETILGHVPRPAKGQVSLARLDDGLPVWIVSHDDGSFDVLGAIRDAPEYCGVTGVRALVRYDDSSHLFDAEWDEYGVNTYAARNNLARYAVALDPERPGELVVGEKVAPSRRSLARPAAGPLAPPRDLDLGPALSLAAAQAAPSGTVVLLDASLVFGPGGTRLCKLGPEERRPICPEGSPEAVGVVATQSPLKCGMFTGPVLTRLDQGKFTNVILLGEERKCGFSYALLKPPERERPDMAILAPVPLESAPQAHRSHRLSPTMSVYLTGAYQSRHFLPFGGQVQFGINRDFGVLENADASDVAFDALLGNNAGAALRGRVASGSIDGRVSTVATLSLATWILNDLREYRVPTLVSPLAPEVGVLLRSPGPAAMFLGFSAPFGYAQYEFLPSLLWLPVSGETVFTLSAGVVME